MLILRFAHRAQDELIHLRVSRDDSSFDLSAASYDEVHASPFSGWQYAEPILAFRRAINPRE